MKHFDSYLVNHSKLPVMVVLLLYDGDPVENSF